MSKEIRVLNSRIVPKYVKGEPFGLLQHFFFCKKLKIEEDSLQTLKEFRKKVHEAKQKRKNSHSAEHIEKVDPSALAWFFI